MRLRILLTAFFAFSSSLPCTHAADVRVSGFGLFGNAELRSALQLLEFTEDTVDSSKVDDGAFLLLTRLTQNGYLDASVSATIETQDEQTRDYKWTTPFEPQLQNDVVAGRIHYKVKPGTLYHYQSVEIEGLSSIEPDIAKTYFIPDSALIARKKDRSYSENILNSHRKALVAALAALGRIDAKVSPTSIEINEDTGEVNVRLNVEEGPLYKVSKAEVVRIFGERKETSQIPLQDTVYTRNWVEDQTRILRNESYRQGYPDTKVSKRIVQAKPEESTVSVHMRFEVNHGPKIILSQVEHRGATDTHLPLLNRKAELETGVPLDITKAEAARRKLSQIGIFDRIDLTYESDGDNKRKAVYSYENGDRTEAQLLLGYGSYEQLRAGILARRENLLGRAHSLSFEAIRSIKSTSGKIDYTVPELLGESIDGTLELNYLNRQEIFFNRDERGLSLGLFKRLPKLNMDLGLDYSFDRKESSDEKFEDENQADFGDFQSANIGSLLFRASRNQLDNLLYPKSGYSASAAIRYADESLGGETSYLRPEFGVSYHKQLGKRWIFHIGVRGGSIDIPADNQSPVPETEFFLVGGENSVRGYRRGEAAPISENGNPLTVESFALLNFEAEYPIFDQLNFVLFADAARAWQYGSEEGRYEDFGSVGLGFRYNTIVGPVRLEYGHNIDPRREDPAGTVHLSIGFPF